MSEAAVAVKVNGELLRVLRATLIHKLEPRLRPTLTDGNVSGFDDPAFVRQFGVGLERVPDRTLLDLALTAAIKRVDQAADGKSDFSYFDGDRR